MAATTDTQEPAPTNTNDVATAVAEQQNQGSGSTTAVTTRVASGPDVVVSHSTVIVPPPPVVTSKSSVRTVDRRAAVRKAVPPVINAVATAANKNKAAALRAVIASLPSSRTPVTDVITAVQDMLTSVAGIGASLARVPSDLASMLGFPGMAPETISGMAAGAIGKGFYGAGPSATVHVPMRSPSAVQWPQLLVTSAHWGASSTGNIAGHPTLGGVAAAGVSDELSVSAASPLVPEAVVPSGVLSSLERTISAVLVPVSLAALAAACLPGSAGLLIISAAGMAVGYRQAKAAATLRAVGIARFARLGPLGVVRSGSLVAMHPRASRVRGQCSGAARHLESVA